MTDDGFLVTSIVATRDRQGYVKVRTPEAPEVQMSTASTRELAMNLLEAAEAAEADARFYRYAREHMSMTDRQAQLALLSFRSFRIAP